MFQVFEPYKEYKKYERGEGTLGVTSFRTVRGDTSSCFVIPRYSLSRKAGTDLIVAAEELFK
jgi:hypothetical protein